MSKLKTTMVRVKSMDEIKNSPDSTLFNEFWNSAVELANCIKWNSCSGTCKQELAEYISAIEEERLQRQI